MLFEKPLPNDCGSTTSPDLDFSRFYEDLCSLVKELYQRKHILHADKILEHARLNHQLQLCYYRLLKYNCRSAWSTADLELVAAVESANLDYFQVPSSNIRHKICDCNPDALENLEKAKASIPLLVEQTHLGLNTSEPDGREVPSTEVEKDDLTPVCCESGYSYTDEEYAAETCSNCGDFCICGPEVKVFKCETEKDSAGLEALSDDDIGLEYSPDYGIHLPSPVYPDLTPDEIGDDLPDLINSGPEKVKQPERCVGALLSLGQSEAGNYIQRRLTRRRYRGVVGRFSEDASLIIYDRDRNVVYRGRPKSATFMFQHIDKSRKERMQLRDAEELLSIYLWWQERYDDKTSLESLFSAALANIPIVWNRISALMDSAVT